MHELSVCLALLEQLERIAADEQSSGITRVILGVGPLSGVEPALLENAFPLAVAGTVAEGAALVVDTVPVRIRCTSCSAEADVPPNRLLCPACGDFRTRLVAGDDLVLQQVELRPREAATSVPVAPRYTLGG